MCGTNDQFVLYLLRFRFRIYGASEQFVLYLLHFCVSEGVEQAFSIVTATSLLLFTIWENSSVVSLYSQITQ
jgi:hypothetical protein